MEAFEMALLFDYYGGILTEKQRQCFDMRYNQDLSLGEIGQMLGISRQAVCDSITRTEALLRRMEENTGCIARDRRNHKTVLLMASLAQQLTGHPDKGVSEKAEQMLAALRELEE